MRSIVQVARPAGTGKKKTQFQGNKLTRNHPGQYAAFKAVVKLIDLFRIIDLITISNNTLAWVLFTRSKLPNCLPAGLIAMQDTRFTRTIRACFILTYQPPYLKG